MNLVILFLPAFLCGFADSVKFPLDANQRRALLPVTNSHILLSDPFLIPNSIYVIDSSETLKVVKVSNFVDSLKAFCIEIKEPDKPLDSVVVVWRSVAVSDRFTFWYYKPLERIGREVDSVKAAIPKPINPFSEWGNLKRSGFITRGLRVGSGGERDLTSGMHLELSGEPFTGLKIEALLDDRDLPVRTERGGSATWREFDRMALRATTAHTTTMLGDFDLDLKSGYWGTLKRQLKGGKFIYRDAKSGVEVAAASGEAVFRHIEIPIQQGNYGPYELTDRMNLSGIVVAVGSDKVWLNGKPLQRGVAGDYRINYERGQIYFNPTITLRNDYRLEVEYEYYETAYPKNFYAIGATTKLDWQDVHSQFSILTAQEGFNYEHPISFEWQDHYRTAMKRAGDLTYGAAILGIDTVAQGEGDYIWEVREQQAVLVFSQPDSLNRPTGYLRVEFSPDSSGAYERVYDAERNLFYYRWVGFGNGGYSPIKYLPLPERRQLIQTRLGVAWLNFNSEIELAHSNYDRNVMSPLNDDDNKGEALAWHGCWYSNDKRITLSSSARWVAKNFQPLSRRSEIDHQDRWGLSDYDTGEEVYESNLSLVPFKDFTLFTGYGYFNDYKQFRSQRFEAGADLTHKKQNWDIRVERLLSNNRASGVKSERWRWSSQIEQRIENFIPNLTFRGEEERKEQPNSSTSSRRFYEIEPGLKWQLNRWVATTRFQHRIEETHEGGKYRLNNKTNSVQGGWQGHSVYLGSWKMDLAHSRMETYLPEPNREDATAALLTGDVQTRFLPLRLKVNYNLSTGDERAQVWVASYVGSKRGGYKFSDGRYIPDPEGDFNLWTVSTDTSKRTTRINFNGEVDWIIKQREILEKNEAVYPFGVSRITTRLETEGISSTKTPTRLMLLDRGGLFGRSAMRAVWRFEHNIYFLDEGFKAYGRLRFRHEDERDRTFSGGELRRMESFRPQVYWNLHSKYSLRFEPLWEWRRRFDGQYGLLRASVLARGGDIELKFNPPNNRWHSYIKFGGEHRRESVSSQSVMEWRLQPGWTYYVSTNGTLWLDGEWHNLTAHQAITSYDLLNGWLKGDNFCLGVNFEYRMTKHLSASLMWRSRWLGSDVPTSSGLMEVTANL